MNFNFSHQPEYKLNNSLTEELIRLYGTPVKFIFMDKIQDWGDYQNYKSENAIFNDFKALKTTEGVTAETIEREIYVLLAESEGYNNGMQAIFNNYGMVNDDSIQVLVSPESLDFLAINGEIHPKEIVSNVLSFPNGKIMEITDCQYHSPGINNKFVYSDLSTCYTLSLKSYNFDNSAVSLALPDKGSIKVDGIESFFGQKELMKDSIKEEAQKDTLVVDKATLEYTTKKSSKIDDVFGLS